MWWHCGVYTVVIVWCHCGGTVGATCHCGNTMVIVAMVVRRWCSDDTEVTVVRTVVIVVPLWSLWRHCGAIVVPNGAVTEMWWQ